MPVRHCLNENHRRAIVSVRFCPSCGTVVNQTVVARRCQETSHAQMRRAQSVFCIDCGEQLVQRR